MVNAISGGSSALTQMWQSLLKKADANGDSTITKTEMQSILSSDNCDAEDIVNILDTDQDGAVSETEFEDTISKLYVQLRQGPPPSKMDLNSEDLFNTIDQDGDGSISETEMESAAEEAGVSANEIFGKLDSDGDGVITQSEFEDALSEIQGQPPQGPPPPAMGAQNSKDIFEAIDTDGDGSVTKDELNSFMAQNNSDVDKIFEEVDTDGDGVITRSESDAHLEKMKEENQAAPEFATNKADDDKSWESMMLEMLLKTYNSTSGSTSTASAGSTSIYA